MGSNPSTPTKSKGRLVTIICEWCKKEFKRRTAYVNRNKKLKILSFCSNSCASKWKHSLPHLKEMWSKSRSEQNKRQVKENNPNWKGGITNVQSTLNSRKKHPERARARKKIHNLIERKKIIRPTVCEKCNKESFCEAHHEDYDKPLEVKWLCRRCHEQEDKILKEKGLL